MTAMTTRTDEPYTPTLALLVEHTLLDAGLPVQRDGVDITVVQRPSLKIVGDAQ